jgi:hypothetical protein
MTKARDIADLGAVTSRLDTVGASDGALSNRNLIINGAMEIDQRYGGAGPNTVTGGDHNVDRFGMYYSGNAYSTQQSTTAPDGFKNSLLMTVTGTSTPVYSFFGQRIEGLNSAQLGFGTSWAKTVTLSFWVRSSVSGIYSFAITNNNGDRAYAVNYTINSANTWEYKTATILGDTTGTWLTTNGVGVYIRFNLGSAAARLISEGSWQAVNADGATGSTGADTWATTSGATFYITGVQLEVGPEATPFEHRSYGDEYLRSARYYYEPDMELYGAGYDSANGMILIDFPAVMRATPTVGYATRRAATSYDFSSYNGTTRAQLYFSGGSDADRPHMTGATFDAEL